MDNEDRVWHRRWVHPAEYATLRSQHNNFEYDRDPERARACLTNGFVRDNEHDRETHDRSERARMREEGYALNYLVSSILDLTLA
jgi:hypothetical protein